MFWRIFVFVKINFHKVFPFSSIAGHPLSKIYLMVHKYCFCYRTEYDYFCDVDVVLVPIFTWKSMNILDISNLCQFNHVLENSIFYSNIYIYLKYIIRIRLKRTCCSMFDWLGNIKRKLHMFCLFQYIYVLKPIHIFAYIILNYDRR